MKSDIRLTYRLIKSLGCLSLLLFVFTTDIQGQDEIADGDDVNKGKFRYGVAATFDYSNRILNNTSSDPFADMIIDLRDDEEHRLWGYSVGLQVSYEFNYSWNLNVGFLYALRGYQTKEKEALFGSGGSGDGKIIFHTEDRFNFIDIPLDLTYKVNFKELDIYFRLGMMTSVSIQTRSRLVAEFNGGKRKADAPFDANYTKVNYSLLSGLGVAWSPFPWLDMEVGPLFRYGLKPFVDEPISARLWSLGLESRCLLRI